MARALERREIPVPVVERNEALERKLAGLPDRLFLGDAADREVLTAAGIGEAPSIVLTTHDDATNVYLTADRPGRGRGPLLHPPPDALSGKTLTEAAIGARTGLNVIALQEDGRMVTHLRPDRPPPRGAHLVALGSAEQRRRFGEVYG